MNNDSNDNNIVIGGEKHYYPVYTIKSATLSDRCVMLDLHQEGKRTIGNHPIALTVAIDNKIIQAIFDKFGQNNIDK